MYIQTHVTRNTLYGQVPAEVQGRQRSGIFLHDSGDVKAVATLESSVW